jgi:hypothetical protein
MSRIFSLGIVLILILTLDKIDSLNRSLESFTTKQLPVDSTFNSNRPLELLFDSSYDRTSKSTLTPEILMTLKDFYYSLNGPYWAWSNDSDSGKPWNFTSGEDPCLDNWQGIGCNCTNEKEYHIHEIGDRPYTYYSYYYDDYIGVANQSCYVKKIFLVERNLTGTIPSSIVKFRNLTHLHLAKNNIFGTLILELGQLEKLELLSVGQNSLSGTIPSSFGSLTKIRKLRLNHNNLTGSFSRFVGSQLP